MAEEQKFKRSEQIAKLLEEFDKLPYEDQANEADVWLAAALKIIDQDD